MLVMQLPILVSLLQVTCYDYYLIMQLLRLLTFQARTGKLSEKGTKFVGAISGWTATLLFMWMPVSQMVSFVCLSSLFLY